MEDAKLSSVASYVISCGLVFGDLLHWLNENAAACGVFLGMLTYITNVYFRLKETRRARKKSL